MRGLCMIIRPATELTADFNERGVLKAGITERPGAPTRRDELSEACTHRRSKALRAQAVDCHVAVEGSQGCCAALKRLRAKDFALAHWQSA